MGRKMSKEENRTKKELILELKALRLQIKELEENSENRLEKSLRLNRFALDKAPLSIFLDCSRRRIGICK